jgi:parallel beta-helix repeat protein
MSRRLASLCVITVLLVFTFSTLLKVQKVEAAGTVYIRADGSIYPPTANITCADNVTYCFSGNNYDSIIVERNNIIIDGNGYVLQGSGSGNGFYLSSISNMTIRRMSICNFVNGILLLNSSYNFLHENTIAGNGSMSSAGIRVLQSSSHNNVSKNTMVENFGAIYLTSSANHNMISNNNMTNNGIGLAISDECSYNIVYGNNIADNIDGIRLEDSSLYNIISTNAISNNHWGIEGGDSLNNSIYHNSFETNEFQTYQYGTTINIWDDGYPSGGNYWSDYIGVDLKSGFYQNESGSDGIGDTSHTIDIDNVDHYPLMGPISFFDAGTWNDTTYYVDVMSNSTLSHFHFDPDEGAFMSFWVKGETTNETIGFCRVAIPKDLLWVEDGWTVLYGSYPLNYTEFSDENCTYLYFTYTTPPSNGYTTVTINGTNVIPEFPSFLILLLCMTASLLAMAICKRRKRFHSKSLVSG